MEMMLEPVVPGNRCNAMYKHTPTPTHQVDLPGGQDRLRQMILYVSERCRYVERFGLTKLNKIIWKADFDAFAARGVPVTGRSYQRLKFGPAAKEMLPIHREMRNTKLIKVEMIDFGDNIIEHRTIPLAEADLRHFTKADICFVDTAIDYYREKTGAEASDDSHGVAWSTREDGDPMPYESAFLSDEALSRSQRLRMSRLLYEKGWISE